MEYETKYTKINKILNNKSFHFKHEKCVPIYIFCICVWKHIMRCIQHVTMCDENTKLLRVIVQLQQYRTIQSHVGIRLFFEFIYCDFLLL